MENVSETKSGLLYIFWLFYKPKKFFEKLSRFELTAITLPLILSFLGSVQITGHSTLYKMGYFVFVFFFSLVGLFLLSLVLRLLSKMDKSKTMPLYAALLYIGFIMLPYHLLGLLFSGFVQHYGSVGYSVLSVAYLVRDLNAHNPFIFGILTILDFFQLWRFYLIVVALVVVGNISYKRSFISVGIFFILMAIVSGLLNSYGIKSI